MQAEDWQTWLMHPSTFFTDFRSNGCLSLCHNTYTISLMSATLFLRDYFGQCLCHVEYHLTALHSNPLRHQVFNWTLSVWNKSPSLSTFNIRMLYWIDDTSSAHGIPFMVLICRFLLVYCHILTHSHNVIQSLSCTIPIGGPRGLATFRATCVRDGYLLSYSGNC